jgi:DNA-binding MarR family transcriptional regulator
MADGAKARAEQPIDELLDTLLMSGQELVRRRELARRLGLATSTVTRLVDRLEAAGLAERRSQRPDRRSVLVGLSAAGGEALQTIRTRLRALLGELLAALPPRERRELVRLLTKLLGSLRPQTPALGPASA